MNYKKPHSELQRTESEKSTAQRIQDAMLRYRRYLDWQRVDLDRYAYNARAMWGVNYGAWPAGVVEALLAEKRIPPNHNILWEKAKRFVGAIRNNEYEPRYTPVEGELDSLVIKLQDMYYSDKINMKWGLGEIECLLDSTCGVGYETMWINDRFSPFGNIQFKRADPRRILLDPGWQDTDVDNLNSYFSWKVLSVQEIKDIFPEWSEKLENTYRQEMRDGIDYGRSYGYNRIEGAEEVSSWGTVESKWGGRHAVIEYHYLERKRVDWEYDKKNRCYFPDTGEEYHSDQDKAQKMRYVMQNHLTSDDIIIVKRNKTTKYIRAMVPSVDDSLFLIDDPDIIQTGNINLYPLGHKVGGLYIGLVDDLSSTQREINQLHLEINYTSKLAAKNSGTIDAQLVEGDEDKAQEIGDAISTPGKMVIIGAGRTAGLPNGGVNFFQREGVAQDTVNRLQSLYQLAYDESLLPQVMSSQSVHPTDSAKKLDAQMQTALIGMNLYNTLQIFHENDKAAAYPRQAKITYKGVPRNFANRSGEAPHEINRRIDNPDGTVSVEDDIGLLPEVKCLMIPSKTGYNYRTAVKQDVSNLAENTGKNPALVLINVLALEALCETTTMSEELKTTFKNGFSLVIQNLVWAEEVKGFGLKAQVQKLAGTDQSPGQAPALPGQEAINNIKESAGVPGEPLGTGQVPQQKSDVIPTDKDAIEGTPQQPTKE